MTQQGPKKECQQALAQLYEYLDDEINTVDRETVRAHLEMCRPCLDYFEFERLFNEFVKRQAPRPKAREEFKSQLLSRISSKREQPTPVRVEHGSAFGRTRFAMAAAITLLMGVGAWWVGREAAPASSGWARLAAFHAHTAGVEGDGIETPDMTLARQFILERMGCEQFPKAHPPAGMTNREACVLPWDCDGIAQFEMSDGSQEVSMFVAYDSCLPLPEEPRIQWREKTYGLATIDGLRALCWKEEGGYVCVMMGEADFGTMLSWAESVRQPSSF